MISVKPVGMVPLLGNRIVLERAGVQHASYFYKCYKDKEFMSQYRLIQNLDEKEDEISERLNRESATLPQFRKSIEWVIKKKSSQSEDEYIGIASLASIQKKYRHAEFLIGLLDKKDHTSGAALEATLLIFDYAFNQINLHKLISFVYGYNQNSQNNTLELGFTQEGLLREHIFDKEFGFIDLYQNGLLEHEFRANKRLAKLSKRLLSRDITQVVDKVVIKQMTTQERELSKEELLNALLKK